MTSHKLFREFAYSAPLKNIVNIVYNKLKRYKFSPRNAAIDFRAAFGAAFFAMKHFVKTGFVDVENGFGRNRGQLFGEGAARFFVALLIRIRFFLSV